MTRSEKGVDLFAPTITICLFFFAITDVVDVGQICQI